MRLVDLWSLYGRSVVGLAQGHFWGYVKGEAVVLSSAKKLNDFLNPCFQIAYQANVALATTAYLGVQVYRR